jgi:hypothetical protein
MAIITEQEFKALFAIAKPALHKPNISLNSDLGNIDWGSSGFFPHSESYDLFFCNEKICYIQFCVVRIQQPTKKTYWTIPTDVVFSHAAIKERAIEKVLRNIRDRVRCEAGGAGWGESAPDVTPLELYLKSKGLV